MPRRTDLESILIIGSGPIVIGQAQIHNRRRCPSNGKDRRRFTGGEVNTVGNILSFRQSSGTNNASREKDGDAENVEG